MCGIPDMWYVEPSIVGFFPPDDCALGLAMAESERVSGFCVDTFSHSDSVFLVVSSFVD